MNIDNFDEVRAALRNELRAVITQIKSLDKPLPKDISVNNLDQLVNSIKVLDDSIKGIQTEVKVTQPDVNIPEIKIPDINVPEIKVPQVNIPAPIVNVPETVVNVPELDLSPIIDTLKTNLEKLRKNSVNRPMAVRLSDGEKWISQIVAQMGEVQTAIAGFNEVVRIKNADGSFANITEDLATLETTLETIYVALQGIQTTLTSIETIAIITPLEISRGNVSGYSFIEKFGRNQTVASGNQETIWDGSSIYSYPTSATITHAISTNAADTMAIEVQGLDSNYALVVQDVTLTGTTQVALSTALIRVFRVRVTGSTATQGIVSISDTGQANTYAQIAIGTNQTNMAVYTVPAGKTGYLHKWYASLLRATGTNSTAADVDLFRRDFGGVFRSTQPIGNQNTGQGSWQYKYEFPIALSEKTDVEVRATPTANADISAGFTILLIDN